MIATNSAPAPRLMNGSLLAETFALYRRGFKTFVGIAAVVEVPMAMASFAVWSTHAAYGLGFPLALVWLVTFTLESAAICEAAAAIYEVSVQPPPPEGPAASLPGRGPRATTAA